MLRRSRVVMMLGVLLLALWAAAAGAARPVSQAFATDDPPRPVPGELLVRYRRDVPADQRVGLARAMGARPLARYSMIDVERVAVAGSLDSALARFRADPRVQYAEPNFEVHALRLPNDPRLGEQYGLSNLGQTGGTPGADISALHAWDVFTGDSTLKIGMIDSGIDYDHPDLAANVWTNPGEIPGNGIDDDGNGYVDDVHGYDFANNDGDPMDDNGHGTHTAGIVAAVGNNGVGVTGVAWRAQLVAIKFLNAQGSGTVADAIASLQYAVTVGCRLTSNSWGGGSASQAMQDAIDAAGAAGLLFVAAAGNSYQNMDLTPAYPAGYDSPYILSVAATDDRDSLAVFSNYGANTVDIAAPGVAILSTLPGERYGLLSGTSMACPMVAGVAALALGQSPNLGPLAVKNMIMAGADVVPALVGLVRTGRLNAFKVIATPDSIPPGLISDLVVAGVGSSSVDLTWTATGDDGATGRASAYDARWSVSPITPENFAAAARLPGAPEPNPSGARETFTASGLPFSTTLYLALRALDEFANPGPISNPVTATTLGAPRLSFTPDSLLRSTITGGTDSAVVTLGNVGEGTLDFEIPTPAIAYSSGRKAVHASVPSAKGAVEAAGLPVTTHAGGPDGFGYRWVDSDTAAGPRFDWIDVTAIGSEIPLNGDDNLSLPIPLGFGFPFYGSSFDSVRVCTNGFLTFTDDVPFYVNQPLPSTVAPWNGVMPLWDDLLFAVEHRAWFWGDGTRCVIEYLAVPHFESGGPYTFEVILLPTGEIRFQYLDLQPPLNSATIGIQDGVGLNGLQVAFNAAYLHDSLAVKIVPARQWISATPTSGRVNAGETSPVTVHFSAAGLAGGEYRADLGIVTNDPATPTLHVPVHLHVEGAPDIQVTPATLAFGDVYVGARPSLPITINNPGTDVLVVSQVLVSDTTLIVDPTPFQLARFARRVVPVTWAPDHPGPFSASITLQSNDPDQAATVVAVTGNALPAPSVATAPESLSAALRTGASVSQVLAVLNRGGGDYAFRAVPLSTVGVPPRVDREAPPGVKGASDLRHGVVALGAGGPDGFGYTYRDSREPGGPAFRWEEIRTTGVSIILSGDDALSAPFALPFDFPFYAESFRALKVCTNGFVTFTSTSTGFSNTPLPSQAAGVPENLLAVMWDDFTFPSNQAWLLMDSTHAVVEFDGVTRFGEPGRPNTFEVAIDASGAIEYRYLAIGALNPSSATVGIQNGARDDGLQAVFNAPYLGDSLAVRFTRPPRWLTVTPDTGRVVPGGSLDLAVTFHGAGLSGGRYDGRIQLEGNDPLAPHLDVPVHLDVEGVPILTLTPSTVDFGRVSIGVPFPVPLTVSNTGSDTLRVDKLASDDARFTANPDRLTIGPFDSQAVTLTFAPLSTGVATARLTVRSNDPATPEQSVPLAAVGAEPPRAALSTRTLRRALAHGMGDRALSGTQPIVLGNTGGNDLVFHARALPGPGANVASARVDHESPKGSVDPPGGPSATGTGQGGPDAFGYRWVTSDDPSGPPFQWIDARLGGAPVPLNRDDQTSAPIALPFRFPFYGGTFDSIRVCTNGFASFTSGLTTFTNTPLPNAGSIVPENLLAAFWDDQDFRPVSGSAAVFTSGDTSRFVIAFYDVPHLTIGGPYTYEIVLRPDGTFDYRYLTMGTRLTEATIGIQNGDRTIGLQAAFNAAFVHDHLSLRFTRMPPWVAVSPESGRIAPGDRDTLHVTFSAAGYPDGDYDGAVRVDDNDPAGGVRELPAHLHVGLTAAAASLVPPLAVTSHDQNFALRLSVPGHDARGIDPTSVRVNDTLEVEPDPAATSASYATVRGDVLDLLRPLGGSVEVPIAVSGEIPGETWFAASDTVTELRPAFLTPAGLAPFGTGGPRTALATDLPLSLTWSAEPGARATRWDLWLSKDAGSSWIPLASGLKERSFRWAAPTSVDSAMIEVVGTDAGTPVTALISDPFRLAPAESLNGGHPVVYRLSMKGPNPVQSFAALALAIPGGGQAEVVVFDVTGARVRTLVRTAAAPEFLRIQWDLRDDDGRAVRSGIYFVRAASQGRVATTRLAVLR